MEGCHGRDLGRLQADIWQNIPTKSPPVNTKLFESCERRDGIYKAVLGPSATRGEHGKLNCTPLET